MEFYNFAKGITSTFYGFLAQQYDWLVHDHEVARAQAIDLLKDAVNRSFKTFRNRDDRERMTKLLLTVFLDPIGASEKTYPAKSFTDFDEQSYVAGSGRLFRVIYTVDGDTVDIKRMGLHDDVYATKRRK